MPTITFYKHEPIPMEMHKVKIVQQLHLLPTEQRLQKMQEAGFNTFQLHNKDIFLDMLTDSGVNAMSDRQQAAMLTADDAYAGSETFYKMQAKLQELFGIENCLPAHQGRACENILATRFVKPGSCVIMNYHFTTAKAHITRLGGRVEELVKKEGLESRSDLPFKGDIDLDALAACRRNGAWIDGALKQVLKRDGLSGRDAAFASRIAYGVMQSRIYLDRCLARCLTQRPEKLEPLLLDILRVGAYQILLMDKVPVNAAVNEAVEMAKAHKLSRAAGLVNAVLRNVDRRRGEPLAFEDELEALSVQTSHPRALVERMVGLLGAEEAEAFLRADNEPVPTTIQTNTLKTTAKQLRASLEDEGVTVEPHPWLADCFTVSGTGDLEGLRAWREGWFTVQDAAAKLTALAAAPKAGSFVIDTCAAPGGKSFAMAMCMEGKGHILSCDVEEHKLRLMEAGAERLGIECMEVRLADGRVCDEALAEKADIVVCDVPCSGLGIIRKKPDIRYKDMASLAGLPTIQSTILDNASRYVRRSGTLVYSTCTVLPEENERVTDDFLSAHPEFTYESFSLPNGEYVPGHITLWPQRSNTDGFYLSRMRRRTHD